VGGSEKGDSRNDRIQYHLVLDKPFQKPNPKKKEELRRQKEPLRKTGKCDVQGAQKIQPRGHAVLRQRGATRLVMGGGGKGKDNWKGKVVVRGGGHLSRKGARNGAKKKSLNGQGRGRTSTIYWNWRKRARFVGKALSIKKGGER